MAKPSKRSTKRRTPDAQVRPVGGPAQPGGPLQTGPLQTGPLQTGAAAPAAPPRDGSDAARSSPPSSPPSSLGPRHACAPQSAAQICPGVESERQADQGVLPGQGPADAPGAAHRAPGDGRSRRCVASGAVKPEGALIRFARAPDGVLTPDLGARLPGRGVWVSADRKSLAAALRRDAFSRAFDAPTTAPAHLADLVEALLAERCRGVLGMARRAGALQVGAENVATALRSGGVSWLIEARDGARDGRERLLALAAATGAAIAVTGLLSGDELGMALGRDRVVHASLSKGGFADRWASEAHRLAGFRTMAPEDWSV
jgi:predicted RNA-binding protein YlxR (DUF448 family)